MMAKKEMRETRKEKTRNKWQDGMQEDLDREMNLTADKGVVFIFFQAEDGIRDIGVTGVQTCALPIWRGAPRSASRRRSRRVGSPSPAAGEVASDALEPRGDQVGELFAVLEGEERGGSGDRKSVV